MITIKDETEEFAWDPNQIKTKYQGQLIKIKGNIKLRSKRVKEYSSFVFLYTKWPIEIYTNSIVKEYSNFKQLKIDIETCEEENIKKIEY